MKLPLPTIPSPEFNISPRVAEYRSGKIAWMVHVDMEAMVQTFGEAVLGMTDDTATPQASQAEVPAAAQAPVPQHTGEAAVGIVEQTDRLEASRLAISRIFGGL